MSSVRQTLAEAAARKEAYAAGHAAGKLAAYDELIELFRDLPMWGAVAVNKIEKLKNKQEVD